MEAENRTADLLEWLEWLDWLYGHAPHGPSEPVEYWLFKLGLSLSASASDIRKRKRQIALSLHPDKISKSLAAAQRRLCLQEYRTLNDGISTLLQNGLESFEQHFDASRTAEAQRRFADILEKCTGHYTRSRRGPVGTLVAGAVHFHMRHLCCILALGLYRRWLSRTFVVLKVGQTMAERRARMARHLLAMGPSCGVYAGLSVCCLPALVWISAQVDASDELWKDHCLRDAPCRLSAGLAAWGLSGPVVFLSPLPFYLTVALEAIKSTAFIAAPYRACTFRRCVQPSYEEILTADDPWQKPDCCVAWARERLMIVLVSVCMLTACGLMGKMIARLTPYGRRYMLVWLLGAVLANLLLATTTMMMTTIEAADILDQGV